MLPGDAGTASTEHDGGQRRRAARAAAWSGRQHAGSGGVTGSGGTGGGGGDGSVAHKDAGDSGPMTRPDSGTPSGPCSYTPSNIDLDDTAITELAPVAGHAQLRDPTFDSSTMTFHELVRREAADGGDRAGQRHDARRAR